MRSPEDRAQELKNSYVSSIVDEFDNGDIPRLNSPSQGDAEIANLGSFRAPGIPGRGGAYRGYDSIREAPMYEPRQPGPGGAIHDMLRRNPSMSLMELVKAPGQATG